MSLHHYTLQAVPLFADAFRDETERGIGKPGRPEIYPVFELSLPTGTRRYAGVAVGSAEQGLYEPKVTSWGTVSRGVDIRQSTLSAVEIDVEISDFDRDFAKELAGHRGTVRRSEAVIRLVSPNVPDSSAFIAFSGILDSYAQTKPFTWTLRLKPNDVPLQLGNVPKVPLTQTDWPAADPDVLGEYAPIIYGIHDSENLTAAGMVPTLYVDQSGFRYLVSLGSIQSLDRVYVDGVLEDVANYELEYDTVNGTQFSLITFTTDQVDAVITADVHGLTDVSDGSGTLITNPADQIRHFLVNFVWGDWRSGDYLAESIAPLHTTHFAQTALFLNAMGHEGSKRVAGSQSRAADVFDEWLDAHEIKGFWTNGGKLAIRPIDHRTDDLYGSLQWLRGDEDATSVSYLYDSRSLTPHMSIKYLFGEVESKFFLTLEVSDISVDEDATVSRDLPWSSSRLAST